MFSKFYYKRKLKKYLGSRQFQRRFLNIKELKRLVVAIECKDFSDLRKVEKEIKPLLRKVPRVSYVIFLNIPKVDEIAYVVSTRDVLLFKEDVVRRLTPRAEVVERIDALKPDVFVNLNRKPSAVIDFLSAVSLAKMRVGFEEKKELSELMLTASTDNGYKLFFEKLLHFMGMINDEAA